MREIKFRGKRKESPHEWLIGDLNHIDGKVFIFDRSEDATLNGPDYYEVIPETIGQYIGIKDKYSIDIYDGDITNHSAHKTVCKISWINKYACFSGVCEETGNHNFYQHIDEKFLEKTGNIHDKQITQTT